MRLSFFFFNNKKLILRGILLLLISCMLYILIIKSIGDIGYIMAWILRFFNGLIWYSMGFVMHEFRFMNKIDNKKVHSYFYLLILLLLVIICSFLNPNISLWSNKFGDSFLLYLVGGIAGTLFMFILCKLIGVIDCKINILGQNTLLLLFSHDPIKRVLMFIFRCIGFNIKTFSVQLLIFISLLIIEVSLVVICQKWKSKNEVINKVFFFVK